MHTNSNDLSRAVVLFLGFGFALSPRRDEDRLVDVFGTQKGTELKTQVASLLDEVGSLAVDWSTHSLASVGKMVRAEIHRRHPELSEAALRAIEWKFTYDWR